MEEVKALILQTLDANGGRTDWDTIKSALDYRQAQMMPNALRELKAEGLAMKQNRIVDGQPVFEVFRLPVSEGE